MEVNKPDPETKPKRRRYRIPRSCDKCRISKVKCVLENGRCNNCVRLGVTCTFANPGSLKERPPTHKDVEQLKAHIRSLERLLHAVDPSLDLNNLPDPDRLVLSSKAAPQRSLRPLAGSTSQPELHTVESNAQDCFDSQLSTVLSAIQGLQIEAEPAVTHIHWTQSDKTQPMSRFVGALIAPDQYIGPNSVFSVAEAAAFGVPKMPPWDYGTQGPVDEYLRLRHKEYLSSAKRFYPEPDLEQTLITIYFEKFHPSVPVIHPTTFRDHHISGLAQTNPTFRALCLLMFSIASRWSTDPRVQLDLAGRPHQSQQFAGMRFTYAGLISLLQPGYDRTTLVHLQAFTLLTIVSLGAHDLPISWIFAERGLLLAQECGAHREVHDLWNADPLQDYLRRQAFFQLYEMAYRISYSLNRAPLVAHDDFDLQPMYVQRDDPLGIFENPYSSISPAVHQVHVAFDQVRVSLLQLGSLKHMLPLLFKMQASAKAPGGAGSIKSLKAMVDQLDLNATRWFDKVPPMFKRADTEAPVDILSFSAFVITYYSGFQMLIHQTLFNYRDDDPNNKATRTNPHVDRFVEFAILSIQAMDKLRLRKVLTGGFYWLPFDLMLTVVLLVCSIRKQRDSITPQENQVRRDNICLAIAILDELAPSVHTAAAYSRVATAMFRALDETKASLLDSLKSSFGEQQSGDQRFPTTDSPAATTVSPPSCPASVAAINSTHLTSDRHDCQDGPKENSWDPLEISSVSFDASALTLPFFTIFD
ncbi:hypothetical protein PGTUg99_024199 [Puccinia graminis f. sp. tritici]|uniref:Zn(2)-C6 fungal-type domain-containing protein n=1 Tax=Puccinia graminis f. sp. tritici TaxID=56615 RepID=A0A5B0Q3Q2_PUCGR|nr:hypothetical protein PGTUg99_024199 [Puccinia graminis f. sp. tritici]